MEDEVDPLKVEQLQQERKEPKKQFTKNPVLNEVLNNTKPFTSYKERVGLSEICFRFVQRTVNENIDKTVTFTQQGRFGLEGMRALNNKWDMEI